MGNVANETTAASVDGLHSPHFDFVFAGFGASASLLLLAMDRRNLLNGKKVLIFDPDQKDKNDKTFCFWAEEGETILSELQHLITHSWAEAVTGSLSYSELNPYRYYHIPALRLYEEAGEVIKRHSCQRLHLPVDEIKQDEAGTYVSAGTKKWRGGRIFDSRPPEFQPTSGNEVHILQSFIGWVIETENPIPESQRIHFMDFDVEQNGGTQFIYLLPYNDKTALVELTRFGTGPIQELGAELQLKSYISKHLGPFCILSIERGCIPMSNAQICTDTIPGLNRLGARNYAIKPSTGYAFKNMHHHATEISNCLANSDEAGLNALNTKHSKASRGRFAFYDALLLRILKEKPELGKPIFLKLFQQTKLRNILRFLDEKSTPAAELRMFSKLPVFPFIRALVVQSFHTAGAQPVLLLMVTLLLFLLGFEPIWQASIGNTLLLAGMFLVGIPHGAVDHLLESGNWNKKIAPGFIVRYLLKAALMALFWYVSPNLALLFFLSFSAWHFGQADGEFWGLSNWISTLWGASVLAFILGTHAIETNEILKFLHFSGSILKCPSVAMIPWFVYAIHRKNMAFAFTILWLSLASYLPLMFAFGLYFIGQHSSTSWMQICRHLQLTQKRVWLHALPFHISAWLLMSLFFFTWPVMDSSSVSNQWAVFFIFIACISFPHALAMKIVYTRKSE
jgi:lycopene beta-cyclase